MTPNSLSSAIDLSQKRILLTGGSGFLGKHVLQQLQLLGVKPEQVRIPRSRTHDLRRWEVCQEVVQGQDVVIHLAAHVGGIGLNQAKPAELFYDNLIMGSQLIHAAYLAGVEKFVCVGTICAYPKLVLADEPTAALDSKSGREVVTLMEKLAREQGCTILMVTHDNRILDIADRVLHMEDGRLESQVVA